LLAIAFTAEVVFADGGVAITSLVFRVLERRQYELNGASRWDLLGIRWERRFDTPPAWRFSVPL